MKAFKIVSLACIGLCGLFARSAFSQTRSDQHVFEMLAHHVQSRMGLSLDCSAGGAVVMLDGNLVYEQYFGRQDRKPDSAPVTAGSRFPFFSVSKGFGAGVLASLVSRGEIGLDDPVEKYLEYFKGPGPGGTVDRGAVTVRCLASHSSGLPSDSIPPRAWKDGRPFSDVKLEFMPGTSFLYTEMAMRLLGEVMERASGKSYEELLMERITRPLGLGSVGFLRKGANIDNVVSTGVGLDSSYIHYSDEYSAKPYPGSGLYGSLRDIARYGQLWLDGGEADGKAIFSSDYIPQAWRTQPPGRNPAPDYGLLFWLFPQVHAVVFSGMAHTICAILPEERMVVVMGLNQREDGRGWSFEDEKISLVRIGQAIRQQLGR